MKRGNFKHDCQAIRSGSGEIVPRKRPKKGQANNYLPCDKCLGFFAKHQLYKHERSCQRPAKVESNSNRNGRARGALLIPASHRASDGYRGNVIERMNQDDIFEVIP